MGMLFKNNTTKKTLSTQIRITNHTYIYYLLLPAHPFFLYMVMEQLPSKFLCAVRPGVRAAAIFIYLCKT